jgi:putative spermidine/putrescine transport system substrate-binding protein
LPPVSLFPQRLKGSGVVRVASSGGALSAAMRRAIFAPFEALTGIKVEETEGFSPAQIKSQVDSGDVQWDVVTMEFSNALQLDEAGDYLENLDYALIETKGFAASQVHQRALGGIIVGTVITYRTDAFGGAVPGGYKDFWDTRKFPGPRNWMSGAIGISPFLEGALLADGVAMQDLYPLDVGRALRSLDRVRGDIVKFWESGAQSAQLMADDETVLGIAWNGRVAPLIRAGMKIAVQWNQAMFQTDCWVIPKGAGNAANAQKFIAFAALAEPQARLSLLVDYGFTNPDAAAFLPQDRLAFLPSHYLDKGFTYDSVWWGKNKSAVTEAFVQWSLG